MIKSTNISVSCVANPDPGGSGAFLTPGSGMLGWGKNPHPGFMDIPDHFSQFRELDDNFLGLKYLNSLM
jgi:hypothetical protein